VTEATPTFRENSLRARSAFPIKLRTKSGVSSSSSFRDIAL